MLSCNDIVFFFVFSGCEARIGVGALSTQSWEFKGKILCDSFQ